MFGELSDKKRNAVILCQAPNPVFLADRESNPFKRFRTFPSDERSHLSEVRTVLTSSQNATFPTKARGESNTRLAYVPVRVDPPLTSCSELPSGVVRGNKPPKKKQPWTNCDLTQAATTQNGADLSKLSFYLKHYIESNYTPKI